VGDLENSGTVRTESVDADRWTARGLVKVTGDASIGEGTVEGTVTVGGKLTANALLYRGTVDVEGAVDVGGTITGSGSFRAGQTFHAGDADLKGTVRAVGATSVDRALAVRGSLAAPSLKSETFTLEGDAEIPGDLAGTTVSARLTADSTFGTVRARSVTLRARGPNLVEMFFWNRVHVNVDRIEADTVELEGVEAKFVHAPEITLGRHAHVTQYEGTIVKRHPTSRVGYESKSRPPYGLRR
jgi:hypothetical protein